MGTSLGKINFAGVGNAVGARGYAVNSNEEFPVALKSALDARGPAVIDIAVSDKHPGPWDDIK